MKPDSLSSNGLKPWVKSVNLFKEKGIGWHRDGEDISYKMNGFLRNRERKPGPDDLQSNSLWTYYYFTLSFTYELLYDNDTVFFAHAVPYTYTYNLLPFLDWISRNKEFKATEDMNQLSDSNNHKSEKTDEQTDNDKVIDYSSFLRIGTLCNTLAK